MCEGQLIHGHVYVSIAIAACVFELVAAQYCIGLITIPEIPFIPKPIHNILLFIGCLFAPGKM